MPIEYFLNRLSNSCSTRIIDFHPVEAALADIMAKIRQLNRATAATVTKPETKKKRGNKSYDTTRLPIILRSMSRTEINNGSLSNPSSSVSKTENHKMATIKAKVERRHQILQKNFELVPKPRPEFNKRARETSPDIIDVVPLKRSNKNVSKRGENSTGSKQVSRTAAFENCFAPLKEAASDLRTSLGPSKPETVDEPLIRASASKSDTSLSPSPVPIINSLNEKAIAGVKVKKTSADSFTQAPPIVNTFTQTSEPFPKDLLEPDSSADDTLNEDDPNFDMFKYVFGEENEFLTPETLMSEFVPDHIQQQTTADNSWDKMLEALPEISLDPKFFADVTSELLSDLDDPAFKLENLLFDGVYPNPDAATCSIEDFDLSQFLNDGTSFLDPLPDIPVPETTVPEPDEPEVVTPLEVDGNANSLNPEYVFKVPNLPVRKVVRKDLTCTCLSTCFMSHQSTEDDV